MQDDAQKVPPVSTAQQQSWGALIAIVLILAMVITGAVYAWNKRMATTSAPQPSTTTATTTATTTP